MNRYYYILNDGVPEVENDLMKWAEWFEKASRSIAKTFLPDGVRISTVFLGVNHRFGDDGAPILFETMIFGGEYDEWTDRYETMAQAKAGHEHAVKLAKGEITE